MKKLKLKGQDKDVIKIRYLEEMAPISKRDTAETERERDFSIIAKDECYITIAKLQK